MDIVISLTLGLTGNLCMAIELGDIMYDQHAYDCWYQGLKGNLCMTIELGDIMYDQHV
jgi:hypothetical protein